MSRLGPLGALYLLFWEVGLETVLYTTRPAEIPCQRGLYSFLTPSAARKSYSRTGIYNLRLVRCACARPTLGFSLTRLTLNEEWREFEKMDIGISLGNLLT